MADEYSDGLDEENSFNKDKDVNDSNDNVKTSESANDNINKDNNTDEKDLSEFICSDNGHETVMNLIVGKDEVTWKTILLELVNNNRMDPWNVDIKQLTKAYMKTVKNLKNHDFRVSAKMILAAAMLLKVKSSRLLNADLNQLDQLFANTQEEIEEQGDILDFSDEDLPPEVRNIETQKLIPRTPQPRKRKVSIYDLVDALEKALEVKERRIMKKMPSLEVEIPKKNVDVSILMDHLFEKIEALFNKNKDEVFFTDLLPGETTEDKVITFVPLLHLENQRKIDIMQNQHFGPIRIDLNEEKELKKEIL